MDLKILNLQELSVEEAVGVDGGGVLSAVRRVWDEFVADVEAGWNAAK